MNKKKKILFMMFYFLLLTFLMIFNNTIKAGDDTWIDYVEEGTLLQWKDEELYFCTERNVTGMWASYCSNETGSLTDPCRAGLGYIVTQYNGNNYHYIGNQLHRFLLNQCNVKDQRTSGWGSNDYIYNQAVAVFNKLNNLNNESVSYNKGSLSFSGQSDGSYESTITLSIPSGYKASCNLSSGATFSNSESSLSNLTGNPNLTISAPSSLSGTNINLSCCLYYEYYNPYYYDCGWGNQNLIRNKVDNYIKRQSGNSCNSISGLFQDKSKIVITKKDDSTSARPISDAKFGIYTKSGNTYNIIEERSTTNGTCTFSNLDDGTYYIKETYTPRNYDPNDIVYPTGSDVTVSDGYMVVNVNKTVKKEYNIGTVINKRVCNARLKDLGSHPTKAQLVELYQYELARGNNYNHLLVFNDPKCSPVNTCSNQLSTTCLKPNLSVDSSFNENNLSCYTDTISADSKTGYCMTSFTDANTVSSYNPQKAYSGQLYFDVREDDGRILSGNFNQTCYFVNNISSDIITNGKKISDYIFDLKMTGSLSNNKVVNLSIYNDGEVKPVKSGNKFHFTKKVYFKIPEVWVDMEGNKISNECSDKNCRLLGNGILSQLNNEGQDSYEFSVNIKTDTKSESKSAICSYESEKQVLCDDKLCLEFREIDINNPFPKKDATLEDTTRNTMTNWCYDASRIKKDILNDDMSGLTDTSNISVLTATALKQYYQSNNKDAILNELKEIYGGNGNNISNLDFYKDGVINEIDAEVIQKLIVSLPLVSSCGYDNLVVQSAIKNAPNSYGFSSGEKIEPKYRIRLTPTLMEKIKEISNTRGLTYDNFNLDCKDLEGNDCTDTTEYKLFTSKLLTDLKSSNDLTINYSTKR